MYLPKTVMLTTYMRRLRGRSFEGELSWNMPGKSGAACVRALEVVYVEEEALSREQTSWRLDFGLSSLLKIKLLLINTQSRAFRCGWSSGLKELQSIHMRKYMFVSFLLILVSLVCQECLVLTSIRALPKAIFAWL